MKTIDDRDLPVHCSEAVKLRFAALEILSEVGSIYYNRWLQTGEILPAAEEYCLEVKQYYDAAKKLQTDSDNRAKEAATNPVSMKSSDQELTERVKSLSDDEYQIYKWLRKHYSERWIAETLSLKKMRLRKLEKTLFSKLGVPNTEGMLRIYGHLIIEEVESSSAKELSQT